jgi:hypothetical protein
MQLEKPVLPLAGAAKKYVRIPAEFMPPARSSLSGWIFELN